MSVHFRRLASNDPVLDGSKLLDAVYRTIEYAEANDGIGLTKSGAFNRKFCYWAAEHFPWVEYSAFELLRFQKTLNEQDVRPVIVIHHLLSGMKLGRHVRDRFRFKKNAFQQARDRGAFFEQIAKYYLFQSDHTILQRRQFVAPGNWDLFLNVINVEAHHGTTHDHILKTLYGYSEEERYSDEYWDYSSFIHLHILLPLYWIGFLQKTPELERFDDDVDVIYSKTPLWHSCLKLDTDDILANISIH